jgi:patatin-like phospholipase/acyl hydrolase
MTARMLIRLEELLAKDRGGSDFRLCHYFDYIGRTSIGAIIAAALSRGMSSHELLEFYLEGRSSV